MESYSYSEIPVETGENELANLASSALLQSNVKYVASLLNVLSCTYCRTDDGMIDTQVLQGLKKQATKSICGLVFKKGYKMFSFSIREKFHLLVLFVYHIS